MGGDRTGKHVRGFFIVLHYGFPRTLLAFQVGVPSRTEVAEYRDLGAQINELVGRINGTYGTLEYSPVHYINQSLTQV